MSTVKAPRSFLFRLIRGLLIFVVGLAVLAGVLIVALRKPRPASETGPAADALGHKIEQVIGKDAWANTGAVKWVFGGRNRHLWDRKRNFARVTWGDNEVLIYLTNREGKAFVGGKPVEGDKRRQLLDKAYAHWINDSFWLNPLVKLFDDGVTRSVVKEPDGREALMITYGGGGLTPGDSYLWLLDENGRPRAWQMWVSIIPIGGLESSWSGWTTLPTGAQVSTEHKIGGMVPLRLTEVAGAATLAELVPGPDPFAALLAGQ